MPNIFKEVTDFLTEIVIILVGLYYVINFKSASKKALQNSPDSIKIFNNKYKFQKGKHLAIFSPYFILIFGLLLILIGILLFFHVIKFR